MRRKRRSDASYIAFFLVLIAISLFAIFDPFETASPSGRTLGGLVLGPFLIWYAFRGWKKGAFPELSRANRDDSSTQFWFCVLTFNLIGSIVFALGLMALFGV